MTRNRGILAIVLIAVGLVWIGQGLGWIQGQSFMVDDARWAWIGGVIVLLGLGVAVQGRWPRR